MPLTIRRALSALAALAAVSVLAVPAFAHAYTFNPLNIISYETWRGSNSMSNADIQAFLDTLDGPLKSLETTDYVKPGGTDQHGIPWAKGDPAKTAAQIIGEAARYWNINPKVLLSTLQKEQSLLTVSNRDNAARLKKAMGYGVYDNDHDGKIENLFPGFGNQVFNSARGYSQYETRFAWYPGKKVTVEVLATKDDTTIVPVNACTYGLYKYTPYYPQKLFWTVYTRYFGDTQTPPRMRPVYRFRNIHNGTYYYTKSEAKRYTLIRTASAKWDFGGASFTCDTSASANTVPLMQMYNTRKAKYYYTTSKAKRDALLAVKPLQWRYDGVTCYVTNETSGTSPVYRLENRSTGALLLTSSSSLLKKLTTGSHPTFRSRGIYFYLGKSATTTVPVGP